MTKDNTLLCRFAVTQGNYPLKGVLPVTHVHHIDDTDKMGRQAALTDMNGLGALLTAADVL